MTQRSLAVLIVLNVVLLAAIALTYAPDNEAQAQLGGRSYLMIAGNTSQAQQQVIYVMDTGTSQVAAFTVNSANGDVNGIGTRNIGEDLRGGGGANPR